MSKAKPNKFWDFVVPVVMLLLIAILIIFKSGILESFDWLVIIILSVLLIVKMIEWLRRDVVKKPEDPERDNS